MPPFENANISHEAAPTPLKDTPHTLSAHDATMIKLGEYASYILHDMKSPLAAIRAMLQVSERKLAAEGCQMERLPLVYQELDRMAGMIQGFLQMTSTNPSAPRPLDAKELLEETFTMLNSVFLTHQANWQVMAETERPVLADAGALRRIAVNLATNALEAGAHRFVVTVGKTAPKDPLHSSSDANTDANTAADRSGAASSGVIPLSPGICLTFADDGPGLPKDDPETVFRPFYTDKESGTGLGLPSCRQLAEEMAGSLRLLPTAQGAAFLLTLPKA